MTELAKKSFKFHGNFAPYFFYFESCMKNFIIYFLFLEYEVQLVRVSLVENKNQKN